MSTQLSTGGGGIEIFSRVIRGARQDFNLRGGSKKYFNKCSVLLQPTRMYN